MENTDNLIEKYKKELLAFSQYNSTDGKKSDMVADTQPVISDTADAVMVSAPVSDSEMQSTEQPQQSDETLYKTMPEPANNMQEFLQNNPGKGSLRVQTFASDKVFPVANATVKVTLPLQSGEEVVFEGLTDANGIVDNIPLSAPLKDLSQDPNSDGKVPFATYNVTVEHPRFATAKYLDIPIFDSVKSIQPVELIPLTQFGTIPNPTVVNESNSEVLFGGEK